MGQEAGDDVGHEDGAQGQEQVLHASEAAPEHEQADRQRGEGHADVAARSGETSMPAAIPANSAQIVPTLATTRAVRATWVRRRP